MVLCFQMVNKFSQGALSFNEVLQGTVRFFDAHQLSVRFHKIVKRCSGCEQF